MNHPQGHKANYVFAPKGAWQSDESASKKCLGYEPFGSLLPGRNYSSDSYRFGFQGQEHDDEINGGTGTSYSYEYRMHDPRVGRFLSIDPLTAKYPFYSPYSFSGNRVIDAVELEGLEPWTLSNGAEMNGPFKDQRAAEESYVPRIPGGSFSLSFDLDGVFPSIPSGDPNPSTGMDLGVEWITGDGPRHQSFGQNDPMTIDLSQHYHIDNVREDIRGEIANGATAPYGKNNAGYSLGGWQGFKYVGDILAWPSGGLLGNYAAAYLGSYSLSYEVMDICNADCYATTKFRVTNSSTIESATRFPPVLSYTPWWQENIAIPLGNQFQSGPLSPTSQEFNWTEDINLR